MKASVAVIFTCFNRKEKTIMCLQSLLRQNNMPEFDLYVCDDGSTDGTSEAIKRIFPKAIIISGNGKLFWSRGMHIAMQAAVKNEYKYYLMINDDAEFLETMWQTMTERYNSSRQSFGVTGCMKSKETGQLTYSGAKFYHDDGKKYVGEKIGPGEATKECDLANWNCFLVNDKIIQEVGIIDSVFEHSFGDFDYSLRMRRAGYKIYLSHEYVGYCENNSMLNTYRDGTLSMMTRIKKILAPNGLPIKSWYIFTFRYYGVSSLRNFIVPYVKFLMSLLMKRNC